MDKKKHIKTFISSFILGMLFLLPFTAMAASLNFSPAVLSRTVGNTFSVVVYVSSPDKTVNAVSGTISFPADKLEIVGISKAKSIVSLWVQEPAFSNAEGTFGFEGIALNPGFIGSRGNIISVTFRAKSSGQAKVYFTSGSVLANDGAGTNILENLGTANFSIESKVLESTSPSSSPVKPVVEENNTEIILEDFITEPPAMTYYPEETKQGTVSKFLADFIGLVLNYISAIILGLFALAVLFGSGAYVWYNSLGLVRRLRKESRETGKMVDESFKLLRKDINEHISLLKRAQSKRKLTEEEILFLQNFEEELTEAEEVIGKKMDGMSTS